MASSCHKRCGKPSFVTPTEPHFFKIILDLVTDTKKLSIPLKFVRENGGSLKSKVNLQVPSGLIWEVDLLKNNREIWLDKGWQAFSDYHSLNYGDFLLFKYLGNSDFFVVIIDRTATEISYPIRDNGEAAKAKESENLRKKGTDDDISVEFMGECSSDEILSPSQSQSTSLKRKRSCPTENKMKRKGMSEQLGGNVHQAVGYKSKKPVFKCAMKQRHIDARTAALKIPLSFSRKFITKKTVLAMLNIPGKRSWKVKLNYHTTPKGEKRVTLMDGWFAFVTDNCLGVGDICTFKLIEGHEFAFTVSISWQAGGSSHPQSNKTGGRGNQSFKTTIQRSYADRKILCVPGNFFKKHTKKQPSRVKLEVGGKFWRVDVHANGSQGQLAFRGEWENFARYNSLEVGDECEFKLIDGDRDIPLLKVFITRFG